jgi:lycopene cyclase domain-containing protein
MTYTWSVVLGVLAAGALDVFVLQTRLVRRKAFWTAYAIVLFFQLIVNGLLTGLKIVRYDPATILGWRIVHAPVEDIAFGFAMVLATLSLWVWLGRRGVRTTTAADR